MLNYELAVAAHEAGHAICGLAVGRQINEITLNPPEDGWAGVTRYVEGVKHSNDPAIHDVFVAISYVGGELAEAWLGLPDIECPSKERAIVRRRCDLIAPSMGLDPVRLYHFILDTAGHALTINRPQFDQLREAVRVRRVVPAVEITQCVTGLSTVDLAGNVNRLLSERQSVR